MIFPKEFLEKVDIENNQQRKPHAKYTVGKELETPLW